MSRVYILFISILALSSCKRDPENVQPVWQGTNVMEGEWTLKTYNGDKVVLPMAGTLTMIAISDTSGTADLDMTIDGVSNNVEHALYDIKSSIATIYYSRVIGGNSGILVNGESWKVDQLILHDDNKPDTLEMHTTVTGDRMLLSKP